MGSHASVLSPDERWKVISYVKQLSLGSKFVYAPDAATNIATEAAPSATANVPATPVNNNNHN
jgi:hypothetical protein